MEHIHYHFRRPGHGHILIGVFGRQWVASGNTVPQFSSADEKQYISKGSFLKIEQRQVAWQNKMIFYTAALTASYLGVWGGVKQARI